MQGEPLDTLVGPALAQLQQLRQAQNPAVEQALKESTLRLLRELGVLPPESAPETTPAPDDACAPWTLVTDCVTAYLLRRHEEWPRLLRQLDRAANRLGGDPALAELTLFAGLIRAELCQGASGRERENLLHALRHDEARLELWSSRNPPSFRHRHGLLLAEKLALLGQADRAIDAYEGAIRDSDASGDLHLQALARERYGRYWLCQGRGAVARAMLLEARHLYDVWGAPAKVAQLREEFFSEPVFGASQA
jgi:tetratricopeptide (TPR) repeat protein